jgi:hypothetical protein
MVEPKSTSANVVSMPLNRPMKRIWHAHSELVFLPRLRDSRTHDTVHADGERRSRRVLEAVLLASGEISCDVRILTVPFRFK